MRINIRIKLLISLLIVVTALAGYLYVKSFHIVKTSPGFKGITNTDSYLDIYFNKPITLKGLNVSSVPDDIGAYTLSGPKVLRITWATPLLVDTKYTLSLINLKSIDSHILNKKLSFKPQSVNFQKLSGQQKNTLVNSQDNLPSDNLYKILPHYDASYKLEARPSQNGPPDIVFTYLPPPADMLNTGPSKTTSTNLAKQWLTGEGVPLNKYRLIDYDTGQSL